MIQLARRALLALVAALPASAAAAQDYVAPRPGTALQFTVARGQTAKPAERMAVTIRAVERDVVSANTASGRMQYIAKLARGIFTVEVAEAAIVYRHDYQPAAPRQALAAGRGPAIARGQDHANRRAQPSAIERDRFADSIKPLLRPTL